MTTTLGPKPDFAPYFDMPPPPRKRRSRLTIALSVVVTVLTLGLVAATFVAFTQHGKAVDTAHTLATTKADLADTTDTLRSTQDDLGATKADLDAATAQLAVCQHLAPIAESLYHGMMSSLDAAGTNVYTSLSALDDVGEYIDDMAAELDKAGYHGDLDGLMAACTGTDSVNS